jgi:hypothetical protein
MEENSGENQEEKCTCRGTMGNLQSGLIGVLIGTVMGTGFYFLLKKLGTQGIEEYFPHWYTLPTYCSILGGGLGFGCYREICKIHAPEVPYDDGPPRPTCRICGKFTGYMGSDSECTCGGDVNRE